MLSIKVYLTSIEVTIVVVVVVLVVLVVNVVAVVLVVVADHIILIWPIKVLPKLLEATI